MASRFQHGIISKGVPLPEALGSLLGPSTGSWYYVSSVIGSNGNDGSYERPWADLDYAIGRCTASKGDTIVVMEGHSEDVTTQIDVDVAGIRIVGYGTGELKPQLKNSLAAADQTLKIDADDVIVCNLLFVENDTASTPAHIELAAGADDAQILGCEFRQGANDLRAIEVSGALARLKIQGCEFYVTANGPDYAIQSGTGAVTGLSILDCLFSGGSSANAWDDGVIVSDQADTSVYIDRCQFVYGASNKSAIQFSSTSSTGIVGDVNIAEFSEGYGISAPTLARTKDIDVQIPTGQLSVVAQGTSLPFTSGKTIFVSSVTGSTSNDGLTIDNAKAKLSEAITAATTAKGDMIVLLPGHTEAPTAATTVNKSVKIVGIGVGTAVPTFNPNATGGAFSVISITASDVELCGIKIGKETSGANITNQINIATGLKGIYIHDCQLEQGANDPISVGFVGTCQDSILSKNTWMVTANGPTDCITANAGVLTRCTFDSNMFYGGSTTNSWDNGVINSNQVCTGIIVKDNEFVFLASNKHAVTFSSTSAEGIICNNKIAGNSEGYSISAPTMLAILNSFENDAKLVLKSGLPQTTGKYIFVDSAGNDNNSGLFPYAAKATITGALAIASDDKGDMIILMSDYAVTTTATITINKGVSIYGLGTGNAKPQITPDATSGPFSTFSLTASDVLIKNVIFEPELSGNPMTSQINVATGLGRIEITECTFKQGANDQKSISFAGSASETSIHHNKWIVTANGPDYAIDALVGAINSTDISNNIFYGTSTAASWDDGVISTDQASTGLVVKENDFIYLASNKHCIYSTHTSAEGCIYGNRITGNSSGYGINAPTMLQVLNSFENDSKQVAKTGIPQTTGKYIFVHNTLGNDNNDGLAPNKAKATLDSAIGVATNASNDVIVIMEGHNVTTTATITVNKSDVRIVGLGGMASRPAFAPDATAGAFSVFTVAANGVTFENIMIISEGTAHNITDQIHINNNVMGTKISGCYFMQGANDPISVSFAGSADGTIIEKSYFMITGDGPTHGITATTSPITNTRIEGCYFIGGSTANAWDTAAINSNQVNFALTIKDNIFQYCANNTNAINLSAASEGVITGNKIFGAAVNYGIDSGSCYVGENYVYGTLADEGPILTRKYRKLVGVVSVDNSGGTTPQTVFTLTGNDEQLTIDSIWLDLRTAAHLQNGRAYLDRGDARDMQVGTYTAGGNDDGILVRGPIACDGALVIKYAADVPEAGALNIGFTVFYK